MRRVFELLCANRSLRLVTTGALVALLAVSSVGLLQSSAQNQAQEPDTVLYEHHGQFDYVAYVTPGVLYSDEFVLPDTTEEEQAEDDAEEEEDVPVIFFRELLEEVKMEFTFDVDCTEPLRTVSSDATVSIIAEHPRLWRKDLQNYFASTRSDHLVVAFPLDYEGLEADVERIEEEIGIRRTQSEFLIEARVHTAGVTVNGEPFDEEYVHGITAYITGTTIELDGDLDLTQERSVGDESITLEGQFDYEAFLNYNSLYDTLVLRSEPLPVWEPEDEYKGGAPKSTLAKLGPGEVLHTGTIDSIDATFTYDFLCEERVEEQTREVQVVATVSSGELWSKELTVVPTTILEGRTVSFPIDIEYFDRVAAAIGEQIGTSGSTYDLAIEARVHTIASVAGSTIDETYVQVLTGNRGSSRLTFEGSLTNEEEGALEMPLVEARETERALPPLALMGVSLSVLALAFVGSTWFRSRSQTGEMDRAMARARKQYREFLVNVDSVPPAAAGDTIVEIRTLDDLALVAEQAGKPILCFVAEDNAAFFVLDGSVRYTYVMRPSRGSVQSQAA